MILIDDFTPGKVILFEVREGKHHPLLVFDSDVVFPEADESTDSSAPLPVLGEDELWAAAEVYSTCLSLKMSDGALHYKKDNRTEYVFSKTGDTIQTQEIYYVPENLNALVIDNSCKLVPREPVRIRKSNFNDPSYVARDYDELIDELRNAIEDMAENLEDLNEFVEKVRAKKEARVQN